MPTQTTAGKLGAGSRIIRDGITLTVLTADQSVVRKTTLTLDNGAVLELGKTTRMTLADVDPLPPAKVGPDVRTKALEDLKPGDVVIWHGQVRTVVGGAVGGEGHSDGWVAFEGGDTTDTLPAATRFVLASHLDIVIPDGPDTTYIMGKPAVSDLVDQYRPTAATVGQPSIAASIAADIQRINDYADAVDPRAAAHGIIDAGPPITTVRRSPGVAWVGGIESVLDAVGEHVDVPTPPADLDDDIVQVFSGSGAGVAIENSPLLNDPVRQLFATFNRPSAELGIYSGGTILVDIVTPQPLSTTGLLDAYRDQLDLADRALDDIPGWAAAGPWRILDSNIAAVVFARTVVAT